MKIRLAIKDDAPKVSALWEMMVNEMRPEWTPNRQWWEKMFIALLDTPLVQYTVVVAEEAGGNLVGFIDGLILPEPSTGKIHGVGQNFYIMPEYSNSTIAGRLYANIISVALKGGVQILEFFCFPDGIKFWNKRGYGLTRCMMRREVASHV